MLFSSAIFLYLFLPLTLIIYYFTPKTLKNLLLIIVSLIFFAWGGVSYSLLLIISILFNYSFGILISNNLETRKAKIYLTIGVGTNLLLLCTFKYANFVVDNINSLLHIADANSLPNPQIMLPVGISFYTFHSLSYLVDIYRREAVVQRKPVDLMLYISFFPQLVAGPIVRYHEISDQLNNRLHSSLKFTSGAAQFIQGLAKKVLLANTFAYVADKAFNVDPTQLSSLSAWFGIVSYTFQIYFDFSGYSDMAIGLARMFGFEFPENFNFPYLAKSIKEFWHRWHISLSRWFKDYLYVPLGGNRISNSRTYLNLSIVFFATGFWHGASWTFIIWGLYHGFFLIIERKGFDQMLEKMPKIVTGSYTIIIVMMGWILFRADDFNHAAGYYKALVRFDISLKELAFLKENITIDYWIALVIAVLGSFGVLSAIQKSIEKVVDKSVSAARYANDILYTVILLAMFTLSTIYIVSGTYNPFIYYRF